MDFRSTGLGLEIGFGATGFGASGFLVASGLTGALLGGDAEDFFSGVKGGLLKGGIHFPPFGKDDLGVTLLPGAGALPP